MEEVEYKMGVRRAFSLIDFFFFFLNGLIELGMDKCSLKIFFFLLINTFKFLKEKSILRRNYEIRAILLSGVLSAVSSNSYHGYHYHLNVVNLLLVCWFINLHLVVHCIVLFEVHFLHTF